MRFYCLFSRYKSLKIKQVFLDDLHLSIIFNVLKSQRKTEVSSLAPIGTEWNKKI